MQSSNQNVELTLLQQTEAWYWFEKALFSFEGLPIFVSLFYLVLVFDKFVVPEARSQPFSVYKLTDSELVQRQIG